MQPTGLGLMIVPMAEDGPPTSQRGGAVQLTAAASPLFSLDETGRLRPQDGPSQAWDVKTEPGPTLLGNGDMPSQTVDTLVFEEVLAAKAGRSDAAVLPVFTDPRPADEDRVSLTLTVRANAASTAAGQQTTSDGVPEQVVPDPGQGLPAIASLPSAGVPDAPRIPAPPSRLSVPELPKPDRAAMGDSFPASVKERAMGLRRQGADANEPANPLTDRPGKPDQWPSAKTRITPIVAEGMPASDTKPFWASAAKSTVPDADTRLQAAEDEPRPPMSDKVSPSRDGVPQALDKKVPGIGGARTGKPVVDLSSAPADKQALGADPAPLSLESGAGTRTAEAATSSQGNWSAQRAASRREITSDETNIEIHVKRDRGGRDTVRDENGESARISLKDPPTISAPSLPTRTQAPMPNTNQAVTRVANDVPGVSYEIRMGDVDAKVDPPAEHGDLQQGTGVSQSDLARKAGDTEMRQMVLARGASAQIAEALRFPVDGSVELRLSPEELGRVKLSLVPGEAGLIVHMVAERPETLELLRRHADLLAADLHDAGFSGLQFTFNEEGRAERDMTAAQPQNEDLGPDTGLATSAVPQSSGSIMAPEGSLDIRL